MLILTIRTDKPEAEVGLFEGESRLAYETWHAHRELAETLHRKIDELLKGQGKTLYDVQGVVCLEGPGSFTGLRIGLSVANAIAYGLSVPIVATNGDDWIHDGMAKLEAGADSHIALPQYGAPVNISTPKK